MEVAVVGAGDVGLHICRYLSELGTNVILIDKDETIINKAEESLDIRALHGNAMHTNVLKKIDCKNLDLFVAVTGDDSANIVSAARAKELGVKAVLARVDDPGFYANNAHVISGPFGINTTVCASRVTALEILRQVLHIDYARVFEFSGYGLAIGHFELKENSPLIDQSPSAVHLFGTCRLVGIIRNDLFRSPEAVQRLGITDQIVVAGSFSDLAKSLKNLKPKTSRKCIIVGGGDTGQQIALNLSLSETRIELIEINPIMCAVVAGMLKDISVINGDGSDVGLLRDLHLTKDDFIVSVAQSDEINLMAALVAKELGIGKAYTKLNRSGYATIYSHLNVDQTASPQQIMLKFIASYLDARSTLREEESGHSHLYFELRLPYTDPTSEILFSKINLPPMVSLLGVVRKFVPLDPSRDFTLNAGDSLIFAGPKSMVRETLNLVRKVWRKGV